MRWTTAEIAEATGGRLAGGSPSLVIDDLRHDVADVADPTFRRGAEPASSVLYVALDETGSGPAGIDDAIAAGATAVMLADAEASRLTGHIAVIEVTDTTAALNALGQRARSALPLATPVIGITGSVGKTSTKDTAAEILHPMLRTVASPRSFNTEHGVPLTLVAVDAHTEVTILEMGADRPGDIVELCALARPTVGIVTRIGISHTERLHTVEQVAHEKGALIRALPATGTAILNAEDDRVMALAVDTAATTITFGEGGDVRADHVRFDRSVRAAFRLSTPWGHGDVRLRGPGRAHIANAMAASAAALAVGVSISAVIEGLERHKPRSHRLEVRALDSGATLIDDSYNANPLSMHAALDVLEQIASGRRIAVLGPMADLGAHTRDTHREIATRCDSAGIELMAVGRTRYGPAGRSAAEIADMLGDLDLGVDDAVLIKGSRLARLELLVERLLGDQPSPG